MSLGVFFAFIALIGWGFGDFFIQKTTRIIGVYKTLFFICIGAAIALFPFVYAEMWTYTLSDYQSLGILSIVMFGGAMFVFHALQRGKLSVVESVIAIELPLTVGLGIFVGGESLSFPQFLLFIVIFAGIALSAAAQLDHLHYHKRIFEKGVVLAFAAAFLSALTNFYIGTYSQHLSPLFVIWATHTLLALVCGGYIVVRGELSSLAAAVRTHPFPLLWQSLFDNAAWVGYAFATTMIPISLTVMISESYIALAALLGYFLGREKLRGHQILGVAIAFVGVAFLSATL